MIMDFLCEGIPARRYVQVPNLPRGRIGPQYVGTPVIVRRL